MYGVSPPPGDVGDALLAKNQSKHPLIGKRLKPKGKIEKTEHPSLVLVSFSSVFLNDQENRPARFLYNNV
jgi:hypothetical protein